MAAVARVTRWLAVSEIRLIASSSGEVSEGMVKVINVVAWLNVSRAIHM